MSFSDIAVQFDDTEEHIADFWQRYYTFKKEQKQKWDADHKEENRVKAAEYRKVNRDHINEHVREYRKEHPEIFKEVYQRRKLRAEERGVKLNDPEYHRKYQEENREHIREVKRQYAIDHADELKQYHREYYDNNRETILQYHVEYYQENRDDILRRTKEYKETHYDEIKQRNAELRELKRQRELEEIKQNSSFEEANPFRSSYENKVADYLYDSGIQYRYDKSYDNLIGDNDGKLRYDFYLIDYGVLIEIDGEQHYRPVNFNGISNEEAQAVFERTQRHDKLKNDFCAEHGIPLLRIPYYEFKTDAWKEMIDLAISNATQQISA
jgi:hypothetical protein